MQPNDAMDEALGRLEALVGTWELTATFPGDQQTVVGGGQTTFEWMIGGRLLLQRTDMSADGPPSSLSIVSYDEQAVAFRQHYFDSRGVVRLYRMTLQGPVWMLVRTTPDFSPLDFSQRFVAQVSSDGATITGAWEKTNAEGSWEHDFALTYNKL